MMISSFLIAVDDGYGIAAFNCYDCYLQVHLLLLKIMVNGLGGFLCRFLALKNLYHDSFLP